MPSKLASSQLTIGSITADVTRRRMKHIHLRIVGEDAALRISAPLRLSLQRIHDFALSKLGWILKHQTRIRTLRVMQTAVDANVMLLWGKAHRIIEKSSSGPSKVKLVDGAIHLHVRASTTAQKRRALIYAWQHKVMMMAVRELLNKWEPIMGIDVARVTLQRMRTRWGSCTPSHRRIRLNMELLSRPPQYLEYVLVHELAHFFERGHGEKFKKVMDRFLPEWRELRGELNERGV